MHLILFGLVLVLLVICIILLILLVNKNKKKIAKSDTVILDDGKYIDILDIEIPKKIEDMGHHLLFQACYKVYDSFKALDYPSKTEKVLYEKEWHTWQVSLLLALLQIDKEFFIPNPKKTFHSIILEKSKENIENDMQKILKKYQQNVNILKSRDELSNDVIWTSEEVSIIFYYMLIIKKI